MNVAVTALHICPLFFHMFSVVMTHWMITYNGCQRNQKRKLFIININKRYNPV
ncbi:hypothetical protein HanPSC8_Chr04g0152381 [Helianthus annuus]|nr:hypothetical protein HanPSC8_Chr04g0152381 [Helianthus annuus]